MDRRQHAPRARALRADQHVDAKHAPQQVRPRQTLPATAATVQLAHAVPALPVAMQPALAAATATALVFATRALHLPGGGAAIVPVLAGVRDLAFVLNPMLLESLLLVGAGLCFHRLAR
ncbi:MAG: HPP family protein [Planctomycetota bacterium]